MTLELVRDSVRRALRLALLRDVSQRPKSPALLLIENEFDLVVEAIEDNAHMNRDAWTLRIQELWPELPPRRRRIMKQLLMESREPIAEGEVK
jgi:hypothetical protein